MTSRRFLPLLLAALLSACTAPGSEAPPTATLTAPPPATATVLAATATAPVSEASPTASPTPAPTVTAAATATFVPIADDVLIPAGRVRAYPGPLHYAGDMLSFEVPLEESVEDGETTVELRLDGATPLEATGRWQGNMLLVPFALDTTDLAGAHTLTLSANSAQLAVEETYTLEVRPAEERPAPEAQAEWLSRPLTCCTLHYIAGTAAERDLDRLAALFEDAAAAFVEKTGRPIEEPMEVYFIDRMWGNGAFGGNGELAVVYTDRYFGPAVGDAGLRTLALHEFTHASRIDQNEQGYFLFNEGLAVYLAGGHYKPEPLAERGAALEALGYYAGNWPYPIHEAAYLHGALNVAYVVETYGWDKLWEWVAAASGEAAFDEAALEAVTQAVFGLSQTDFQAGFATWRQSHAPGAQLEDLRLTVELQAVRRQYQDTYAPPPMLIFGAAAESYAKPEHLPVVLREPDSPPHVAVELMIANGQAAIAAGDYAAAEALITALEATVSSGAFEDPLAAEYLATVQALTEQGYTVVGLIFSEAAVTARVIADWPVVEEVTLERAGGS